jgi:hypothetical protein
MAGPVVGRVYQFKLFFAVGAAGWTETYTFSLLKVGDKEVDTLFAVGGRLGLMRKAFLSPVVTLSRISIRPISVRGVKITDVGVCDLPAGTAGIGPGTSTGGPLGWTAIADPYTALKVRLTAADCLYHATITLRGIPLNAVAPDYVDGMDKGFRVLLPGPTNDALTAFLNLISNGDAKDPSGTYVLRGRSHDPDVRLDNPVLSMAEDATGCYTSLTLAKGVAVGEPAVNFYTPGERVHLTGVRGCFTKGLNGEGAVVSVGPLNALTIKRRNCCCQNDPTAFGGVLQKIVVAYYAIDKSTTQQRQKVRARKTGKQREVSRGRAKPTCVA